MISFLCGLSKSGKSSMVEATCRAVPALRHIRASALLRSAGLPTEGLSWSQANANQPVLAQLVRATIAAFESLAVIDGHALIETSDQPFLVPISFFEALPINKIVMISAKIEDLLDRREQRELVTFQDIAFLEKLERDAAQAAADHLKIPFSIIASGDTERFKQEVAPAL